jgi:hypothetical protein
MSTQRALAAMKFHIEITRDSGIGTKVITALSLMR